MINLDMYESEDELDEGKKEYYKDAEADDLKRNGRLNNPRQIQLALLKKEIDRRGL
jgi:hypothetical protein